MKSCSFPILLALVLICRISTAAEGIDGKRQQWKKEAILYLHTITPSNATRMAEIQIRGEAKTLRYKVVDEGLIKIGTNGWAYLKINSGCDTDREKAALGDMILAIDQDGNLYENDGHGCGGLLLISSTGKEFQTVQEFLSTLVYTEVFGVTEKWRRLTNETPAPVLRVKDDIESEKKRWTKKTLAYLKTIVPTPATRPVEIQIRGEAKVLRYHINDEGLIRFGTNGWVYIKIHTEAQDDKDKGKIGEIMLAIDHAGNLYQNDGEAESDVLILPKTGKEFQGVQEFLDTPVAGDVTGEMVKWKKLE